MNRWIVLPFLPVLLAGCGKSAGLTANDRNQIAVL
ncbi:hypothetical protein HNO89_002224 [Sporosarcina luteola]|nr:hypothetical protein [Sporosarcina luteola]